MLMIGFLGNFGGRLSQYYLDLAEKLARQGRLGMYLSYWIHILGLALFVALLGYLIDGFFGLVLCVSIWICAAVFGFLYALLYSSINK